MSKHAVVVIDLQNEYLPRGKLPLSGIEAAVANAARIIAHARDQGVPVIHVQHQSLSAEAPIPSSSAARPRLPISTTLAK